MRPSFRPIKSESTNRTKPSAPELWYTALYTTASDNQSMLNFRGPLWFKLSFGLTGTAYFVLLKMDRKNVNQGLH